MAEMVGTALAQEVVSRAVSFVLGNLEKASQDHKAEQLEIAVSDLEFALERTGKLPITDLSLLHRRKMFKRAYIEGTGLLNKHKQKPLQGTVSETGQAVKRRRWITRAKNFSMSSSSDSLNIDNVRRFKWFADLASRFVRDVESGCSLQHYTFCNPLVRHLLEGKTLRYDMDQGSQSRYFYFRPICLEGRGVETVLEYYFEDHKLLEKYFHLALILRLSESTNIIQIAMKCLHLLTSQFNKLVVETAIGELTLLDNLQYISHSHAPPWANINDESHAQDSKFCRPDPVCCKQNGHVSWANDIASSGISNIFPEQVIFFWFQCYVSTLDYNLCSSSDGRSAVRGCRKPLLEMRVVAVPHFVCKQEQLLPKNYAEEVIGGNEERIDISIQQVVEAVRSKAINCFLRQPEGLQKSVNRRTELTVYKILCGSKYSAAGFEVSNPSTKTAGDTKYNSTSST